MEQKLWSGWIVGEKNTFSIKKIKLTALTAKIQNKKNKQKFTNDTCCCYEEIHWSKMKNNSYAAIEMPEKMVSLSEMKKTKLKGIKIVHVKQKRKRKKEFSKCLFMSCQNYQQKC